MKRVFLIVLDSFGIGEMEDADAYGDKGTNTLRSVSSSSAFAMPNMAALGLFNIDGVTCAEGVEKPQAKIARMKEASKGKDTTIGHWEIAGILSRQTRFPPIRMDSRRKSCRPFAKPPEEAYCVINPTPARKSYRLMGMSMCGREI